MPNSATLVSVCLFALAGALLGQCQPVWQPGFGSIGANGRVRAVTYWDPDGNGPQSLRFVFGGEFTLAGTVVAAGLAQRERSTGQWSAMPSGMVDRVHDLAVDGQNRLVVAGARTTPTGSVHVVARWNGTAWTQLGGTFDGEVLALTVRSNGDVLAGGAFAAHGGTAAVGIAQWNGTAWSPVGAGLGGVAPRVEVLFAAVSGDIYVGGRFTSAGGIAANHIARLSGSTWAALGQGLAADVTTLTQMPSGQVFAAGLLQLPSMWDGITWSPVPGLYSALWGPTQVTGLTTMAWFSSPVLVAVGSFRLNSQVSNFATWDPMFGWSAYISGGVEPGTGRYDFATAPDGSLGLVGDFQRFGGIDCAGVVELGAGIGPLGEGVGTSVVAVGELPNGDTLLGGAFTNIGWATCVGLGRQNGSQWEPLGTGLGTTVSWLNPPTAALAFAHAADGSTIVAGAFDYAGAVSVDNIARWDGAAWSRISASGHGMGTVTSLLVRPGGELFAGSAGVSRWAGAAWTQLMGSGTGASGTVYTLAQLPNGDVIAGGYLQGAPGTSLGVMRWSGGQWTQLGAGLGSVVSANAILVRGICVRPDGSLVVVGDASGVPMIAQWNGSVWQALPAPSSGHLFTAVTLHGGDVVVGGQFAAIGGVPAASVARWNGAAWSAFGSGVVQGDGTPGTVYSLHWSRRGELLVGGLFERAGSQVAVNFTRLVPSCPASAVPFGQGCVGSGGANLLAANDLPWLGGTFHAVASGLPANGLALGVLGLGPAFVPLSAVLPVGGPGCTLWTTPDLVSVQVPVAGTATLAVPIPNALALVGAMLHQQAMGLEFGAGGALAALTSSNRLTLTFGTF